MSSHKLMILIFSSDQTCFERVEKEGAFFKDVKQHSNEAKEASMRFRDILPKEQFFGILWGFDFSIKRMQNSQNIMSLTLLMLE